MKKLIAVVKLLILLDFPSTCSDFNFTFYQIKKVVSCSSRISYTTEEQRKLVIMMIKMITDIFLLKKIRRND